MNNSDIVLFETKDSSIVLPVRMTGDTVWLNRSQMAELFERDVKTIGKHINNALREEVDSSTVAKFATVQEEGNRSVTREIEYYNLDMIISVTTCIQYWLHFLEVAVYYFLTIPDFLMDYFTDQDDDVKEKMLTGTKNSLNNGRYYRENFWKSHMESYFQELQAFVFTHFGSRCFFVLPRCI